MTSQTISSTFTMDKRQFLHCKLDEILRMWDRRTGKGSFIFILKDGTPDFEFCSKLDLSDVSLPHPNQATQHPRRRRGPARRERDRQRAARHQAAISAKAAAAATASSSFPGVGQQIGRGSGPTLPLPLQKGDVLPPIPSNTVCTWLSPTSNFTPSTVCTTLSSTTVSPTVITSTTSTRPLSTPVVAPTMDMDCQEQDSDSDDSDDPCRRCQRHFDRRSNPTGCPRCLYVFHRTCLSGHQCVSFSSIM